MGLQLTEKGLLQFGFSSSVTGAKFINKCSLFLQKVKDAGQVQTEDWLCF